MGDGLRLDRFLALRFPDRSRSFFAQAIRDRRLEDGHGRVLRASHRVRAGEVLYLSIPGIAATTAPPPCPDVLYEDDRLLVLDKPPGLSCHPGGTKFEWAVVGLARERWSHLDHVDLAHRLDKDTSGALVLTKDVKANAFLKRALKRGQLHKEYLGLARGPLPWDERLVDAPIGAASGEIRIQMAVRDDGLPARTRLEVLDRQEAMTLVRCLLFTGRTHQIRVHLAHVADGLLGDRLYGVPPWVFLSSWEEGPSDEALTAAGAPRHALHAHRVRLPHPDGGELEVTSPLAADLQRWWDRPEVLPLDRA